MFGKNDALLHTGYVSLTACNLCPDKRDQTV